MLFDFLKRHEKAEMEKQCAYCGYSRNPKSITSLKIGNNKLPACLVCWNDVRCGLIGEVPFKYTFHPLNPHAPVFNKHNFKEHHFIEQDGTLIKLIRLFAEQELREEIIMRQIVGRLVASGNMQGNGKFEVLREDNKNNHWDFRIKPETGDQFNMEITEFTDSKKYRQIDEEKELELKKLFSAKRAPFVKIKKAIEYYDIKDINIPDKPSGGLKEEIDNPLFEKGEQYLFTSFSGEMNNNLASVKDAIQKKIDKPHADKENTILVLDNRSVYFNFYHYEKILDWIRNEKPDIPFKEVLIYTGYYSDESGRDSEFNMMSLMLNEEMTQNFASLQERSMETDSFKELMTKKKWYGK